MNTIARLLILALLLCPSIYPLFALDLEFGDGAVTGSFDTTLSTGYTIRVQDQDQNLIGVANGGTANSINGDNGNQNYDRGDFTSSNVKALHELELNYENYSIFARGFYFYDWTIQDSSTNRTSLSESAERRLGTDFELLDAYISADYELGEMLLTIRGGSQVLNWGESTFIQNGINAINPIDVSKFRIAGAEVRDGLVPIPLIDLNLSINDKFSIEAFYQFSWRHTEIEPEGTFFSTSDFASPGGNLLFLGFGQPGVFDNPPTIGGNPPVGTAVPRIDDRDASDQGQFGFALRYFEPALNDTEFGFYWTRLHSRLPLISGITGTPAAALAGDFASGSAYFRDFPERIDTLGVSFNTELLDTGLALQGEVSYRIDQPLQVDDVEILLAATSPLNPDVLGMNQLGAFGFGEEVQGFRKKDVVQGQFTGTQLLGPNLGADQIALIGEAGFNYVRDMEDQSELRYEGPGTFTSGNPFFTFAGLQPATQSTGFADPFSWGYRLRARADVNSVFGLVNMQPGLAFSHDVQGTTPAPIANFVERRKTATASLAFTYLERYRAEVAYTNFFGGGSFNLVNDRDFVSVVGSVAF